MNSFPTAAICALCLVVFSTSIFAQTSQQPVCASLNAANLTYDQNFDTLATSGTTNTSVPTGFGFSETGVNAANLGYGLDHRRLLCQQYGLTDHCYHRKI